MGIFNIYSQDAVILVLMSMIYTVYMISKDFISPSTYICHLEKYVLEDLVSSKTTKQNCIYY